MPDKNSDPKKLEELAKTLPNKEVVKLTPEERIAILELRVDHIHNVLANLFEKTSNVGLMYGMMGITPPKDEKDSQSDIPKVDGPNKEEAV